MITRLLIVLLLVSTSAALQAQGNSTATKQTLSLSFYEQPVYVDYSPSIKVVFKGELTNAAFEHFFKQLYIKDHQTLSYSLIAQKKLLNLNDWLYFQLIYQTVYNLFPKETENHRTLFTWFLLEMQGYETQLNYDDRNVFLSVFSTNEVHENAVTEVSGRGWMINLSTYSSNVKNSHIANRSLNFYKREKNTRAFDFTLSELPNFNNCQVVEKRFEFIHDKTAYALNLKYNKNTLFIRYKYPAIVLPEVAKTPLSEEATESLKAVLKPLVRNKTNYEAIRLLLSFVCSIEYKTDMEVHKQENFIFSAEETLAYKYSDCEDRAILFMHLVKAVLNLDVILLEKPNDHVACGVALANPIGEVIWQNGKAYTYCDPTGPNNNLKPGEYSPGYTAKDFKVVK